MAHLKSTKLLQGNTDISDKGKIMNKTEKNTVTIIMILLYLNIIAGTIVLDILSNQL